MLKRFLQSAAVALLIAAAPMVALRGVSYASGNVNWTGHGVTDGSLDSSECDESNTPYLLWVFTLGGGQESVTSATLTLSGSGSGTFDMTKTGNEMKATTGYFNLSTLQASVSYEGMLGDGAANLNISHGCAGNTETPPVLDCDGDNDNSPQSDCQPSQIKDCDGDYDSSPQSDCTPVTNPSTDCDGDTDNSPASECPTTTTTTNGGRGGGQVLAASTTAGVAVTPVGGVNAGAGGGSSLSFSLNL